MRHRNKVRKLNRTASHRKATLANIVTALFERKQIRTTHAKAKEARKLAERLITFAKRGDLHSRRMVLKVLHMKGVVNTLFHDIAPKYQSRNGGYTRIVKLGNRRGDAADISILELVGIEKTQPEKKEPKEGVKEKLRKARSRAT